jgi:hypothetical protein
VSEQGARHDIDSYYHFTRAVIIATGVTARILPCL